MCSRPILRAALVLAPYQKKLHYACSGYHPQRTTKEPGVIGCYNRRRLRVIRTLPAADSKIHVRVLIDRECETFADAKIADINVARRVPFILGDDVEAGR